MLRKVKRRFFTFRDMLDTKNCLKCFPFYRKSLLPVVEIRKICVTGESKNSRSVSELPNSWGVLEGSQWCSGQSHGDFFIFCLFLSYIEAIWAIWQEDLTLFRRLSPVISPKYHIHLTSDFDCSTGFHRSPAVISTAGYWHLKEPIKSKHVNGYQPITIHVKLAIKVDLASVFSLVDVRH